MSFRISTLALLLLATLGLSFVAEARPYYYPQVRFVGPVSESMGGVTVPLSEEVGNALMNNPAALARHGGYRSEPLNMSFTMNTNSLSNAMSTLGNSFSLGGLSSTINANKNTQFGVGFSNLSAFAWNGFAVGVLLQEFSNAASPDGTNVKYHTVSQLIPSVGYGFGLARNIIRVGYSLQWVNQASGDATAVSNSSASFLSGIQKGHGLSHNVSVNFAFPFTYLPTFSFMVRNIAGLNFTSGGILPRGTATTGAPGTEPMTVDLAFDYLVRISGTLKTHWYFEYKDLTNRAWIPTPFEKMSLGLDVAASQNVAIRAGMTGILNFSAGISYRGDSSEIGLAYYNEKSPFNGTPEWDSKFALQYKIMLNQKAKKSDGDSQQVGNRR